MFLAYLPASLSVVLVGAGPLLRGFGLLAWPSFCLVGFVWFFCVLVVSGCFLFLRLAFDGFARRQSGLGHLYFAFTCTTKALIDHCTCVSGRFHLYCCIPGQRRLILIGFV